MQIVDDASYNYVAHPRKDYAKAILRIFPFNDYSGDYSGTGITNKVVTGYDGDGKPIETAESITKSSIRGYVIDEQTIFTYAGIVDEDYTDRRSIKSNLLLMVRRMVRLLFPVIMQKRLDLN